MRYFTKYGEGESDIIPLVGFTKTQVRNIAKVLNIPKRIIEKFLSAGLDFVY
ncbi:MAG: hypothetical protein ACK4WJ_06015 [Endomicrobiia bacterium]